MALNSYDLFEGMGYIDDDLVDGALKKKSSGGWRVPQRWLAAAACLAVVALVGWGVWQANKPVPTPVAEETAAEEQPAEDLAENETEQPQGSDAVEVAEPEPLPVENSNGAFIPRPPEPTTTLPEEGQVISTMIEDFPGDYSEACYDYAVKNGAVGFSVPLTDAMAYYGDTVLYRVYVDIFKDGVQLAASDPEVEELLCSLLEDGIISAYESVYQDGNFVVAYPTLHATYDQLQNFKADSAHGWMLFLYAERV